MKTLDELYIYILSASSFNHPSELQLTCLDLHEIDFQSPELATGPTFTHLQSTPSTRHRFIHFPHGFPSRDFSGVIQVALSVANHCWTTAWSEVPRWTRSCWVRISLGVSRRKKSKVSKEKCFTVFTNLTWRSFWQWFPPFLNPIESEVGWSQAACKVSQTAYAPSIDRERNEQSNCQWQQALLLWFRPAKVDWVDHP